MSRIFSKKEMILWGITGYQSDERDINVYAVLVLISLTLPSVHVTIKLLVRGLAINKIVEVG